MIRLDDVIQESAAISINTLSNPTHLIVSARTGESLVAELNGLEEENFDLIMETGGPNPREVNIHDVGDFLGLSVVVSAIVGDGFKILEEITAHSQQSW